MWRVVLPALILLTGCASDHHEKDVETTSTAVVEHDHHAHHGSNQSANGGDSDNIGQDMLEDAESGILSGFLQAIFDSIFHRDDD